jgi:hypothetical protein
MGWVIIAAAAWLLVAVWLAVVIGRSLRLADVTAQGEWAGDAPNFVVDRAPPATAPDAPPSERPAAMPSEQPSAQPSPRADADEPGPGPDQPASAPGSREAPTIPGLPVARPPVGRPAVPRSTRQRPRRSGHG